MRLGQTKTQMKLMFLFTCNAHEAFSKHNQTLNINHNLYVCKYVFMYVFVFLCMYVIPSVCVYVMDMLMVIGMDMTAFVVYCESILNLSGPIDYTLLYIAQTRCDPCVRSTR